MVFLIVINSTSIVLAQEELNQNDTDNGTVVINDSESITIRIEGIHSSSISSEDSINEFENVGKIIIDIISHPLVILLIGAVITKFLVPRLTDKMQARKESFEIKKELIKKINSSTTTLLETTKMLAKGDKTEEEIPPEFLKWRESCAEIGATVRAYWDEGEKASVVEEEWNAYYERVVDLYDVITDFSKEEKYNDIKDKLKSFFEKHDPKIRLEYNIEDEEDKSGKIKEGVDTRIKKFFDIVGKRDERKEKPEQTFFKTEDAKRTNDNATKYSVALVNLVYLFDKRKYYLLKLIFGNKIRSQS